MYKHLTILSVACICLTAVAFAAQPTVVEVVGEASGGKQSTIAEVEQAAKQDAMRQAVEQVAGVCLESETLVEMGAVSKDEVLSWAQGLVKVHEVLDATTDFDPDLKAFRCRMRIRAAVGSEDACELLRRIQDQQQVEKAPLALEYLFLAQRQVADGTWASVVVKDGSFLRSGDQFQISLKPDRDCHAYVINQDASGAVYTLFPHDQAISNTLTGGREHLLPDRDRYYELDSVVGLETFYIAASVTPMTDLEWMIQRISDLGSKNAGAVAMLDGTLRTRGLRGAGRVVSGGSKQMTLVNGKVVEEATQILKGEGALVHVMTVDHRR